MIFATVGTHEQPFNRLIEAIDRWANGHDEEVIIQTGFSSYEPENCKWQKMFTYQEMLDMINHARIVITHGGPSSFLMVLQAGKIPVVVPRKREYNEHVNNHQIDFCKLVAQRKNNIIVVENIEMLGNILERYDDYTLSMSRQLQSNNDIFCKEFERIVNEIMTI